MSDQDLNDQPGGIQPVPEAQMVSPGAQLAAYRKERGWTVEQVASQLNLAPRQIVAIESDDYPSLPGMPIVRGFIRAYAKLLKVDAAPLLATLGGETVLVHDSIKPSKTLSTPFSEARLPSMTERQPMSSKWVIGGLLVVLIGVAIWAARQGFGPTNVPTAASSPEASAPQATGTLAGTASESVQQESAGKPLPAVHAAAPSQMPQSTDGPADAAAMPAPVAALPSAGQPAPVAAPQLASPSPDVPAAAGMDTLAIKVREDSWVEVRRAGNNAVLLSKVIKAGETGSVEINEPVTVVIGNAAGVEVTLRGTPVEVKAKTNSNVARLNLK